MNELRLLLVEDQPRDAELLVATLEGSGYACRWKRVEVSAELLELLDSEEWDLICVDYSLPHFDGLSALRLIRQRGVETPAIVVTGSIGEEATVEALKAGANDCVLKTHLARLPVVANRTLEEAAQRRLRERAEEAVRASERRFRALIEHSADGVVVMDGESGIVYASVSAVRLFGLSADDLHGFTALDLVHADDRPGCAEQLRELLLRPDIPQSTTVRMQYADGNWHWFAASGHNRLADPDVGGIVVNFRDVTRQREAELALQASEEKYRTICEVVSDYAYSLRVSETGHVEVEWITPAFERVTGYNGEALVGARGGVDMIHPDDRTAVRERTLQLLQGEPVTAEFRIVTPTGKTRWLRDYARPVLDAAGRVVRIYGGAQDISERRRGDEERASLQAQLHQAQKMEAVGRLAGGIAHDFNNLLFVINGYSELLAQRLAGEPQVAEALSEIRRAGARGAELTAQLLAFGRKQLLEPKLLDLGAELRQSERMLKRLIGEDVILRLVPASHVWPVLADPTQVQQIVLNLVVNARDAIAGGGTIEISVTNIAVAEGDALGPEAAAGDYVCLSATDTGCGMDAATLARIFEPFFTTKEKGKGTGLGLSTVHGIARQSGGFIAARSEPGRGTTISVYLPRAAGADAAPEALPEAAPAPSGRGHGRILLVEDEAAVRKLLEIALASQGYEVSAASNGAEALGQLAQAGAHFDLLISDVVMPGMSGPELARRARPMHPELAVLFMSGYSDEAVKSEGVLLEDAAFLRKPCPVSILLATVRQLLEH